MKNQNKGFFNGYNFGDYEDETYGKFKINVINYIISVFYVKLKNLITMQNHYFFGFVISLVLINYNSISYNENLILCIFFILFFVCVCFFKAPVNQNKLIKSHV